MHLLPTLWFRNTWSWFKDKKKPELKAFPASGIKIVEANHPTLGQRKLYCEDSCQLLFTENETNFQKLYGTPNLTPYRKDGVNDYLVNGKKDAVNPNQVGSKCAAHYLLSVGAGECSVVRLRLSDALNLPEPFGTEFDTIFSARQKEADEFYQRVSPFPMSDEMKSVQRQAFAGMLWSKQFYHYVVEDWLNGDPIGPSPPPERKKGRNREWFHLYNDDILSMPDKWEYPWFASWDLAFHLIPFAMIDPEFAKKQLTLHPNGQIPAYEWAFGDVNPPVHAWSALRIYRIEKKMYGKEDRLFLERVFQKLLLNFTWWVNRKDAEGNNIFEGGFLGLDNIGVFDRSAQLPTGGHLEQSDGTSWMGMYCLNLLAIALELAKTNHSYEDIASKFFEHFLHISDAMNQVGGEGLWNEEDGFFYDVLHFPNGSHLPLKIRSMVGLIPLFANETLEPEVVNALPGFKRRLEWFLNNRHDLCGKVACMRTPGIGERRLLSIVSPAKLKRILEKMLDESEFFSDYGIRALSKVHSKNPYVFRLNGQRLQVNYEPAESSSGLFGGNSNWRGPIWFPVNFLLIESIQKFHYYLGNDYKVECPTGSGKEATLWEVASEISHRLASIFLKNSSGRRPIFGGTEKFQSDPNFRGYILFFEYFHGDNGAGIGASHQTGWTGLVAKLIQQCAEYCGQHKEPELLKEKMSATKR